MQKLAYFVAPLAALLSLAQPAAADPALREQRDINGDFVIFGNTLAHECEGGGTPQIPDPIVGDVGDCPNDNDFAPDIYWRADAPADGEALADEATTPAQARSTAVLALPEDAEVVYARLYWAALSDMASPDGTVRVQRPSSGLDTEVTADGGFEVEDPNDADNIWYHSTADVTALIQAQGEGAYRIADVGSVNIVGLGSENAVAAWAMVVLYEKAGDPSRNIAIFDGLDLVTDTIGSAEATLSGFLVPNAGFDAKLGVIAYEGEAQFTGDALLFNDVTLSDGQNPANNFFNATRTVLGVVESNEGDLPQLTGGPRSLSNVDLDVIDVTSLVNEGDTAATIEATSSLDTFLLGAFVTSISTFKPEFVSSTKEVIDDNGGAIRPDDELIYRITVINSGSDVSIDTVLTDALPMGVTYVEGSIMVESGANMGAKTDAVDGDQARYDMATRTVVVNVGEGATAAAGGELAIGAETVVSLRVTVDADAAGVIENQAVITAEGEQGAPSEDTVTDGNGNGPGEPPTVIVIDGCDVDDDCEDPTPFCDFASSPRLCVECVTSEQCTDEAEPDCSFDTHVCECASGDCSADSDDDGISDSAEEELGTDPDDADSDDDGVPDGGEVAPDQDSDGDGLINALDPDSDNDALFDGTELGLACGDGTDVAAGHCIADGDMGATTTNPVEADTDGGGVRDGSEDFDRDGVIDSGETDPTAGHGDDDDDVTDTDDDGLSDELEDELHSDPEDADSDDDGVPDGEEPNPGDDIDGDGLPSVLDVDSDNDGLFDGTELGFNCMGDATDADAGHCRPDNDGGATTTSAIDPDTDGGGASDGSEDSNLNGVVDSGETDPVEGEGADDETRTDTDGDGLSDALEMELGTGVDDADSDDDGVPDGEEPNPSDDHDGDGDINARDADSDDDGLFDGTELGKGCEDAATDAAAMTCKADGDDGETTTSAINDDTDFGGKKDGDEDDDKDGVFDDGETDPNDARDDRVGDMCMDDGDCGAADSGVICDDDTCDFGCRGMGGNGCRDGEMCSSMTMEPGTCDDMPMPTAGNGGMGGMAGNGGMGGASGAAGTSGDAGGMTGGDDGAAGSTVAFGTLGGGGCDCRVRDGRDRSSDALLILGALALLWHRRRVG